VTGNQEKIKRRTMLPSGSPTFVRHAAREKKKRGGEEWGGEEY